MPEIQPIYIDAEELSAHRDGAYALNGVLDSTEVAHLQNQMWDYVERLTKNHNVPIRKNQPKTWKSIGNLESLQKMLFQSGSIGHNPMSWHVRTSENVLKEFQELHKTDRLVTSMDGMSIMLPPEKTGFGFQDQSGRVKLHTDQAYRDSTINCWQGQVNLFNVYENDGALRLLRGSHKLHEEFPKHFNQIDLNKGFVILNEEQLQWYRDRLDDDADVCVKTEAGSLLIWTSCTIHQGMNPTRPRPHPENIRCTLYACKADSNILHNPKLSFYKEYLESLGATIPPPTKAEPDVEHASPEPEAKKRSPEPEQKQAEPEPEDNLPPLELDESGVIQPEEDEPLPMGDTNKEVSEEDLEKANEHRDQAVTAFSEGDFQTAVDNYTKAIELNPGSAILHAKRAAALIKLSKPLAAIRDCTKAIEINPDSAAPYKFRGRAHRLLGKWLEAHKDLVTACKLDYDDTANEWLKEVEPNVSSRI
uniref:Hsp70-interacting protein N-terminal domain-containing protein n=1 Tax=Acrobeloides nanus TaxID=290746 RepID=A0A914DQT7_9BILA